VETVAISNPAQDPYYESAKQELIPCDFGYGILRYDIARLSITERVSENGTYEGNGLGCEPDFQLLMWTRKAKKLLGWDKKVRS
jgi:hypothetical protein